MRPAKERARRASKRGSQEQYFKVGRSGGPQRSLEASIQRKEGMPQECGAQKS